jgi:hypothetical protein
VVRVASFENSPSGDGTQELPRPQSALWLKPSIDDDLHCLSSGWIGVLIQISKQCLPDKY